ncbi:MAG: hypothetical protein V4556_02765 [Bacteroidota bacterium]
MKKFFVITILLFVATFAKADCLGYSTKCVWPIGKLISTNSIIIINTGDSSFGNNIGSKYKMYLQSTKTKNKILLSVIEICNGGLNLMQIVLKPSSALLEDEEYELIEIYNSKKITKATRWDLKWKVSNKNSTSLVWKNQPTLINKIYYAYGCGPEAKVVFSSENAEAPTQMVKTSIKNKQTGIETTCYIRSDYGIVILGHNMCWGEFQFAKEGKNDNDEYDVRFSLIDESGNTSIQSNVISFIQPNISKNIETQISE